MTRVRTFPVREVLFASAVLAAAALLSGCNTIEGLGEDVQAGGRAVENTAEDAAE